MRRTVKTVVVEQLFIKLAERFRVKTNYSGFRVIYQELKGEDVSLKYLDDTWRNMKNAKAKKKEYMGSSLNKLEVLVKAISKRYTLYSFEMEIEEPQHEMLEYFEGRWWSLVRANAGQYLFKAPVHVSRDKHGMMQMRMKRSKHEFWGKIQVRSGCLFCELDSSEENTEKKKLYLVLKGSNKEDPDLLQGIYAGISSAGDPIGGKELFVKERTQPFGGMKWQKIRLDQLKESEEDRKISMYFSDERHPVIGLGKVSAFDLSDLD